MRKLLAVLMATLCLCTMGVAADPAARGETNTGTSADTVAVDYDVAETYSWAIHSKIEFEDNQVVNGTRDVTAKISEENLGVKVTNNIIAADKDLVITVIGANNDGDDYFVKNGTDTQSYTIAKTANGDALGANAEVLRLAAGTTTGSQALYFHLALKGSQVVGKYADTLTYTASIENHQ